ncbi:Permease of the drug/metabolite transporter (DMT) superfamily [Pseudoxanthomonas sp. GM95]|uniref:DMT family transporter n=1 Tax=Pseudoxanthomonas sp. GM95 TaxID=1881043 RepID=UPI0008BCFB85|nr:DMT family transporter [Pseudoxanthomonas sp. GM95]SEL75451.1 Permease of the drug/metabolite transporter (DMT) superfamily [Pseudoxanthomonas sp. GM95]
MDRNRLWPGISAGIAAGALWGLVFLTPELAGAFTPLQLAAGRYVAFGVIAAVLLAPRWPRLRAVLGAREWRALLVLGLTGNIVYYVLLASAVQRGGIAMTSLVIGFLPVVITVCGSRDAGALPLRKLTWPLLLGIAGIACVGWDTLASARHGRPSSALGFACALGALGSWTLYALINSRWLARLPQVSEHDWNLLTGVVTGTLSLLLVVPAFFGQQAGTHEAPAWLLFAAVSCGIALLSSVLGNAFWNRASRLLPLTLVGSMILFETLFALLYAFLWEWRGPTGTESTAMLLIGSAVLASVWVHRHPAVPVGIDADGQPQPARP